MSFLSLAEKIRSHLAVFKDRKANCYEHSIIVATVLIGAGYDAYVVDGYATKEVTKLSSLVNFVDTFKEPVDEFPEPVCIWEKLTQPTFYDQSKFVPNLVEGFEIKEGSIWYFSIRWGRGQNLRRRRGMVTSPKKYKARGKKHFISAYQEEMKEREAQSRQEEEEKAKEEEHQRFLVFSFIPLKLLTIMKLFWKFRRQINLNPKLTPSWVSAFTAG